MFEINSSKRIYHANGLEIFNKEVKKSYPYVVRTTQNNGVRGYIIEEEEYLNPANTLSFAQDTFSVFFQEKPYYTGNKVKVLVPKFNKWNRDIALYLSGIFQKTLETFTWGIGSTVETISNTKISLPAKNGKIDFDFMEKMVAELEARHLAELEAYLQFTGLKNYHLTTAEQQALADFENDKIEWGGYRVTDLFEVVSGSKIKSKSELPLKGDFPVYSADSNNNGIVGFVDIPTYICDEENKFFVTFGDHTRTFNIANKSFSILDNVKVLRPVKEFSLRQLLFTVSSWRKEIPNLGYARHWRVAKDVEVSLPIKNGEIDYSYMSLLISAIQKLVIKDVVLYADRKIAVTKQVINA